MENYWQDRHKLKLRNYANFTEKQKRQMRKRARGNVNKKSDIANKQINKCLRKCPLSEYIKYYRETK